MSKITPTYLRLVPDTEMVLLVTQVVGNQPCNRLSIGADPGRPGFERNHHELMALCAPRALLLIGCSMDKPSAVHSDDVQSWSYFNRAREVYELLGVPER